MKEFWNRVDVVGRWFMAKVDRVLDYIFSPSGIRLIAYCVAQAGTTFLAYSWVKVWENEPKTMNESMHPFILVCLSVNVMVSVAITVRSFFDQSVTKQQEGGYEPNQNQNPTGRSNPTSLPAGPARQP